MPVAQWSAPSCDGGGRWFDSSRAYRERSSPAEHRVATPGGPFDPGRPLHTSPWCSGSTASSNLARPGSNPGGLAARPVAGRSGSVISWKEGPRACGSTPQHRSAHHDRDDIPGLRAGAGRLSVERPARPGGGVFESRPEGFALRSSGAHIVGVPVPHPHDRKHDHTTTKKGGAHVVPEAARHPAGAAVGRPSGSDPELGRRQRLGRGLLDAAPPLPRARLGGRLVLRVRVDADPRERAGGRAVRRRGRPARGRRDRPRLDRGPGAEERPGALRARARRGRR